VSDNECDLATRRRSPKRPKLVVIAGSRLWKKLKRSLFDPQSLPTAHRLLVGNEHGQVFGITGHPGVWRLASQAWQSRNGLTALYRCGEQVQAASFQLDREATKELLSFLTSSDVTQKMLPDDYSTERFAELTPESAVPLQEGLQQAGEEFCRGMKALRELEADRLVKANAHWLYKHDAQGHLIREPSSGKAYLTSLGIRVFQELHNQLDRFTQMPQAAALRLAKCAALSKTSHGPTMHENAAGQTEG
jgi:hypothetical protein